jgi:hypothetical protein
VQDAVKALDEKKLTLWREKTKHIKILLASDKAKKYIPFYVTFYTGELPDETFNQMRIRQMIIFVEV